MRRPVPPFPPPPPALLALVALVAILSGGCGGTPSDVAAPRATMVVGEWPAAGSKLDVDGDGSVTSYTDALLIMRYVSGFRGKELVDDAIGARCARCTAPEIELYLGTL